MSYVPGIAYVPEDPLVAGTAHERCRAIVIVPARNEEDSLADTLDALADQRDLHGQPLDAASFEVLLLLNNCTDDSAGVAHAWQNAHPEAALHIAERIIPPERAHVGTARRWLMDTAWMRLRNCSEHAGILSTDSDTLVAPDWIAQNLHALAAGADAVGGVIELKQGELESLPEGARTAYLADREYQRLCAELEDLLDPQAGDPWPRHLEHFGASLACTPAAYEHAGGLPPVNPLEDMAFVDALRRIDAWLRHEPAVRVFTSARFDGRAEVGLSWQLRTWQHLHDAREPHRVPCARWLEHRFRTLHTLRALQGSGMDADLDAFQGEWRSNVRQALAERLTAGEFLARIDSDGWIKETYTGRTQDGEIARVNRSLRSMMRRLRRATGATAEESGRKAALPIHAAGDPSGSAPLDAR